MAAAVAYPALFMLLAGDAFRYSIGWLGWGILAGLVVLASVALFLTNSPLETLRRVHPALALLMLFMAASLIWSQYRGETLLGLTAQLATTVVALMLVSRFSWRQLLHLVSNTIRAILLLSLAIELVAASFGPIAPPFPNYEGDTPPAPAYLWVQGDLFTSDRIQGIVGNANLLGFVALLGLVSFGVEYFVTTQKRRIAAASFLGSILALALAKSAGIGFALIIVSIAAAIAIAAEGKPKDTRHLYYRRALAALGFAAVLLLIYQEEIFGAIGKTPDASGRFKIWASVFELIVDKPVLGWGWISHWIPGVEPFEGLAVIGGTPLYHAHNAYLDVLLQLGVLGLGLLLWLMISSFIRLWRVAVLHTNPLYLWPLLAFTTIAAQGLTESRLIIEIGWVLLVLLAVKAREPFESLEPLGSTPKRVKLMRLPQAVSRALFGPRGNGAKG